MCNAMPQEVRKGVEYSGTGVMDGYKPTCSCWELNSGPLEEQPVPLPTEPALQPAVSSSCHCDCLAVSHGLEPSLS